MYISRERELPIEVLENEDLIITPGDNGKINVIENGEVRSVYVYEDDKNKVSRLSLSKVVVNYCKNISLKKGYSIEFLDKTDINSLLDIVNDIEFIDFILSECFIFVYNFEMNKVKTSILCS